jgi:hypothetical protein
VHFITERQSAGVLGRHTNYQAKREKTIFNKFALHKAAHREERREQKKHTVKRLIYDNKVDYMQIFCHFPPLSSSSLLSLSLSGAR